MPVIKNVKVKEKFKSDFETNFGFGGVFEFNRKTDLFSEFVINIPKIVKNPKLVNLVVLTFSAVFWLLNFDFEEDNNNGLLQLMEINTSVGDEIHNGRGISGSFSPAFVGWLKGFEIGHSFSRTEDLMFSVYNLFYKTEKYENYQFKAKIGDIRKGYLILGCQGTNCCQINPCSSWEDGKGYDFGYHNIDYSHQQITLLAGLAALHDEARKARV